MSQMEQEQKRRIEYLIWEGFMLVLLVLNLALIIFDWLFSYALVQEFLAVQTPPFFQFYKTEIHANFILYDLAFVGIFLAEFSVRWVLAIIRKTYHSWVFYPFIHWYDLLGCIPIGSFRFFRVLRIFSIVYRLERMGVIRLANTYLFKSIRKYYNVVLEEISDRVVLNIIDGVKDELRSGSEATEKIIHDVVQPHKEALIDWISSGVGNSVAHAYTNNHEELRAYVDGLIARSMDKNAEISTIELIPVLGDVVTSKLEKAVSDIVYHVINEAMDDLSRADKSLIIHKAVDALLTEFLQKPENEELNQVFLDISLETLEVVKEKVSEKQWQLEAQARKEEKMRRKLEGSR